MTREENMIDENREKRERKYPKGILLKSLFIALAIITRDKAVKNTAINFF